jgi:hypothetical protein
MISIGAATKETRTGTNVVSFLPSSRSLAATAAERRRHP